MITVVRQLTLSIGTLIIIYALLIILLHKTLRGTITRKNFIPKHIVFPFLIYTATLFTSIYYIIPHRLKTILPIKSSFVRNALAEMLSQSIGLSINFLCITALLCISIDKLLHLYNGRRIPMLITYTITALLSFIAYNTFYITLSRQKYEILEHTQMISKLFVWLEVFLAAIILFIIALIISNYIKSKTNKI